MNDQNPPKLSTFDVISQIFPSSGNALDPDLVRTGVVGARTRRPFGHQLLHPQILTDQISENPSMYVVLLYVVLTFIDRNQFLANT